MNGLIVSAIIENITTRKDNTLKVVLGTQELSGGRAGELFAQMNKLVAVYFSPKETISEAELKQVDALDPELQGKTQSQRIRNVLFKLYAQNAEGFKEFDTFYKAKTEAVIEHWKTKLNP